MSPKLEMERRSEYRVPLTLPVQIANSQSQWVDGETRDVSPGGFLLFSSKSIVPGSEVEYIVSVPNFRSVKLRCVGRVLRSVDVASGGSEVAITMERCAPFEAEI